MAILNSYKAHSRLPRAFLTAGAAAVALLIILLVFDPRLRWLAINTLWLAVSTCLLSLPAACILAFILYRTDMPGRRLFLSILVAMIFLPLYLHTAAWDAGFGQQGWFELAYATPNSPPLLSGWRGAIWVHAMGAIPWSVLIVGAGLRWLPAELEEQALLDAGPLGVFWHVTLRHMLVAISVAALWTVVTTAGEITVTDVFGVRTFAEELYVGFALGDWTGGSEWDASHGGVITWGAWLGLLLVSAVGVCLYLAPGYDAGGYRAVRSIPLRAWRWPMTLLVAAMILLLVGVPLGNLIYKAGVDVQQVETARIRSWSATKMLGILAASPWQYRVEFAWSLQLALLVATLSTLFAVAMAWWLRSQGGWRKGVVLLLLAAFLSVPGPLVGLGIIQLLNHPDWSSLTYLYDHTLVAPCAALMLKALPVVTIIVWYGLASIPTETFESASLDGAGSLSCLWRIALPQRIAAIAVAYFVAMAIAIGDLASTILVAPPGVTTLSIRIFNFVHYGVDNELAGICITTYAVFTLLAGTTLVAAYRWSQQRQPGASRWQM